MAKHKHPVKTTVKQYFCCVLGLFIAALGVAVTSKGGLGVSPISSIPYVMSLKLTFLSFGNWLIIWNCLLFGGQIRGAREETLIAAVTTGLFVKLFLPPTRRKITSFLKK